MSSIDNYGEFEVPEEKTQIEVGESPINIVNSYYEIFFENLIKKVRKQFGRWFDVKENVETVYQETVEIFEGREKLKVDEKELAK